MNSKLLAACQDLPSIDALLALCAKRKKKKEHVQFILVLGGENSLSLVILSFMQN
jgi:hypothetical protein